MRSLFISLALLGATVLLFMIGALGPPVTVVEQFLFRSCVLPSTSSQLWRGGKGEPIHKESCLRLGYPLEVTHPGELKEHHPGNVVFYVTVPVKRSKRMLSRWHHYLLADLDVVFVTDEFPRALSRKGSNWLKFEVLLAYRDDHSPEWRHLASSNVTRVLECQMTSWDYFSCEHLPLFELGSCHYHHYLLNIRFPSLPLSHVEEFRGLGPIQKLNLFEIHQNSKFTLQWFILKAIAFPISLLSLGYLLRHIFKKGTRITLIHKSLLLLNCFLVFYNVPVEVLTLWVDLPWMLVFGDLRQTLFITSLLVFWVIYVGELTPKSDKSGHVGDYWKKIMVAGVSLAFFFIYEFCERGVQVFNPFFTLWGNFEGRIIAYCFLVIAMLSALIYCLMLLVMIWRVFRNMRQRLASSQELSSTARARTKAAFSELKHFLILTAVVALLSVCGYILPTEIFLLHALHGNTNLSLYGALLVGNYGLWNMYTLIMTFLYSPSSEAAASNSNLAAAYNLLTKPSQE